MEKFRGDFSPVLFTIQNPELYTNLRYFIQITPAPHHERLTVKGNGSNWQFFSSLLEAWLRYGERTSRIGAGDLGLKAIFKAFRAANILENVLRDETSSDKYSYREMLLYDLS